MIDLLRVAAISIESRPGETARNLELIRKWCARAAAEGVQLALFPELSLTGFIPNHPQGAHDAWLRSALAGARRMAEPISGQAVTALAEIAAETGIHIAAGLLEDAGNLLYNAMVLVAPGGIAGVWRKMHIPMYEMPFYSGGPAPEVVSTTLGRIGANICFDALLPESTRLARGAQCRDRAVPVRRRSTARNRRGMGGLGRARAAGALHRERSFRSGLQLRRQSGIRRCRADVPRRLDDSRTMRRSHSP